ncbi:MAG: FRG domain-containing protein [Planctomycetota bacterium]
MPGPKQHLRPEIRRRYAKCPIDCRVYQDSVIRTLGEYFAVFHSLIGPSSDKAFWFRGHDSVQFRLAPSALRYTRLEERNRALELVTEMKRFLEMKLPKPPARENDLEWIQVAQHFGLPTRLLDWTQNAAVALFFACWKHQGEDGLVVTLNPIELNQSVDPRTSRILNPQRDADIISPYLKLDGRIKTNGKRTIAINPTWNTERIAMQQGAFTLHGSRRFELDQQQASSLLYVPIFREHKDSLLTELERVGIGEMFIFPEPEHVCAHLRRHAKL